MINRRNFLKGGLSMLSLTPLIPTTGIPSIGLPLPFATATPSGYSPTQSSLQSLPAYLGVVGPESGPQIELNQQQANGVRGAISDANTLHGTLDRTFDLHLFDDLGDISSAPTAANSLISDAGVLVAIGHLGNATTDAALPTYAQAQIPLIIPTATNDHITQRGYRNVFRLATRDGLEGQLAARHLLKQQQYHRILIITPTHGYGPDVAKAFAAEAHATKIPATLLPIPITADDNTLQALLNPALHTNPDVIFFAGTTESLAPSFRVVVESDYRGMLAGSQGFFDMGTITSLGKAAEGLLVSSSMPHSLFHGSQQILVQNYNQQYGQLTPIAAFSYAAAQIAIAAIRRISALSRTPIIQAIAEGGTYTTIIGDFRFDAFGDPMNPNIYFYRIVNSTWTSAGSFHDA